MHKTLTRSARLLAIMIVSGALASSGAWRGFKAQHLIDNRFAVSYTPKTIMGKVPNMMLLIIGNTGALCLDKGYSYAKIGEIEVGNKYQGIKQLSTTVEFFHEVVEGASACGEMANKPKTPQELKNYREPHAESQSQESESDSKETPQQQSSQDEDR